jgi:hypothetical protein
LRARTAGRTLYYGGILFALIGALVMAFPLLNGIAISTSNPIPNLDSVGVSTILVLGTVGVIGVGSMIKGYRELVRLSRAPQGRLEAEKKEGNLFSALL